MIIRDYKVGDKVVVVNEKSRYVKGAESLTHEVPIGWAGTVTRKGTTEDWTYHDYDVQGDDGTIIKGYPSPCLMKVIPGTERDVIKMIKETEFGIDDEVERLEYLTARRYLEYTEDSLNISMMSIYLLGKAAGKREERAKKKAHLTEVR